MINVSIIIPVYNASKTIARTLNSVKNLTFENYEVIIIDDGSVDDSLSICHNLTKSDSRYRIKHINNSGVSSARNLGLRLAVGRFVMFLDADDELPKDSVNDLYDQAVKSGSQLVMGQYLIRHNGEDVDSNEKLLYGSFKTKDIVDYLVDSIIFKKTIFGSACRCLFSKKILDSYKIEFPKCKLSEDQIFLLDVIFHISKLTIIEKVVYYYNMEPTSATHERYKSDFLSDRLIHYESFSKILEKNELFNNERKEEVLSFVILNSRKQLCFNAALSRKPYKEYFEIKHSVFFALPIQNKYEESWLENQNKNDRIVYNMIRYKLFTFLILARKIRNR